MQRGVKESISEKFNDEFKDAISTGKHFSFETNFHTKDIAEYLTLAERKIYEKILVFIVLNSVELSKERVTQRVARNGHFVPNSEIELRYSKGLKMLDEMHSRFDEVRIHESLPEYQSIPCLVISKQKITIKNIPSFIKSLPILKEKVKGQKKSKGLSFDI